MNPVYSPASTGVPFTNTKGIDYPGHLMVTQIFLIKKSKNQILALGSGVLPTSA